jgi:hypothetical protein
MPQRGRKNADQALLLALACGATLDAAAQKAGVSPATAYRRSKDPEFQQKLQELTSDMVRRTAGGLTAAGLEFVRTLVELTKPPMPAAVRLGAAKAGLEIGFRAREAATLEERMAALEQQLSTMNSGTLDV